MREREESTPAVLWTIQLTLEELTVIEHALTRLSAEETDRELDREPSLTASLLSRLLGKTAPSSHWSRVSSSDCADVSPAPIAVHDPWLSLDEDSLTVTISNERFVFKPTAFRLLSHLIHRRGRWIRTDKLRRDVLATAFDQHASNVRWHVLQVRRALGSHAHLIHSDNRLGFMFDPSPCGRRHCWSREAAERPSRAPR